MAEPRMRGSPSNYFTNLFVYSFGADFTEKDLRELFSRHGAVTSCKLQTDEQGRSKNCGYVNYRTHAMAIRAMEQLNGYTLPNGKHLMITPFENKAEREKRRREEIAERQANNQSLRIENLDPEIDEFTLNEIFSAFGTVIHNRIVRKNERTANIAFLDFDTSDSAARAIDQMDDQWMYSRRIYVRLSKSKFAKSSGYLTPVDFENTSWIHRLRLRQIRRKHDYPYEPI